MHIGKTLPITKASELLAEKDNGDADLRWVIRYCLSQGIKLCIKIPAFISTWERRIDYYKAQTYDCGKCTETMEERERLENIECTKNEEGKEIYLLRDGEDAHDLERDDAEYIELPSYCSDCGLNAKPMMGKGDYIGKRVGILFLGHNTIERFTYSDIKIQGISRFYVLDDKWGEAFVDIEIASEKEEIEFEWKPLKNDSESLEFYQCYVTDIINKASDVDFLSVELNDLFIWKEDWEESFRGEGLEERKEEAPNKKRAGEIGSKDKKRLPVLIASIKKLYGDPDDTKVIAYGDGEVKELIDECYGINKGLFAGFHSKHTNFTKSPLWKYARTSEKFPYKLERIILRNRKGRPDIQQKVTSKTSECS